jgi:phenylalanyl-tRNA synthetase beta chain
MPTISIDKEDFLDGLETTLSDDELREELSQLGTDVESIADDEIKVEIFPNRPDLLSSKGLLRNLKGLLGEEEGLPSYTVNKSDYTVSVDSSVKTVRPHTACAVVTGLELDDKTLESLIELQEKIHVTYGRQRSEAALGLYPLESISFPITYKALEPNSISFQPLGWESQASAADILSDHEKGSEYGSLLSGHDKYPVFTDDTDNILSMPPIINSEHVGRVTTRTKALFIECSGFNMRKLERALNIVCADLSDQGASIHRVTVETSDQSRPTPTLDETDSHTVRQDSVSDWLGVSMTTETMLKSLEKMRYNAHIENSDTINVSNPTYRIDIQGESDIIEDIAIGYGYNRLSPDQSRTHSNGGKKRFTRYENKTRETMVGAGFQELYTFSLGNYNTMKELSSRQPVKMKNSLSKRFNALRSSLIPKHLATISENTHYAYPKKLFETGRVFVEDTSEPTEVLEQTALCATICGSSTGFSDLQQVFKTVADRIPEGVSFKPGDHTAMIDGRCSQIIVDSNPIGIFGEIHPEHLDTLGVNQPVTAGEVILDDIIQ